MFYKRSGICIDTYVIINIDPFRGIQGIVKEVRSKSNVVVELIEDKGLICAGSRMSFKGTELTPYEPTCQVPLPRARRVNYENNY